LAGGLTHTPSITPERWQEISPYLDEALSLPAEERAKWLESFRVQKPELSELVQKLLEEHNAAEQEHFLEKSPTTIPTESGLAGQTIGVYRLLSHIGQGGMGSVWLAERSDGRFERRVAIKFLHLAVAGVPGGERFKREGRILGQLAHPHIAELVDAGITPGGEPYLVLEHIEGEHIDEYCDKRKLDVETRIKLFLEVLSAVAHAHANLIVHRDIKPSNVLVRNDGAVKLLDFGIAKLLSEENTSAATLLTAEAGIAMTPKFAAPEQVTGGSVTTATDVYGLGVLLYLLLTGRHPIGPEPHSPVDLVKAIVEAEPRRASEAVRLNHTASSAMKYSTAPEKLARELSGDLDTILIKALKKRSEERYSSVVAFAQDLQRYLRHEPITARPDTVAYRAKKFVRRNRMTVALTAFACLALVAGIAGTLVQAGSARRQRDAALRETDRASRIAEFMTGIFKVSDPGERVGSAVTAREVLDKASKDISSGLSRDPELRARMMYVMGEAYLNLGLYSRAQSLLEASMSIESAALGPAHPETLRTMQRLAWTLFQEGRFAQAEQLQKRTLETRRRALGPDNDETLSITSDLANTLDVQGDHAQAEKMEREVFHRRSRTLGPGDSGTLASMDTLAAILVSENRLDEAEKLESQALATERRVYGDLNLNTIHYMMNEAAIQGQMGRDKESEQSLRQLLELERQVLGPDQPETAVTLYNLASEVAKKGNSDEALSLLRQSIDHGLLPQYAEAMGQDPDLKTLHGKRGFTALITYAKRHATAEKARLGP